MTRDRLLFFERACDDRKPPHARIQADDSIAAAPAKAGKHCSDPIDIIRLAAVAINGAAGTENNPSKGRLVAACCAPMLSLEAAIARQPSDKGRIIMDILELQIAATGALLLGQLASVLGERFLPGKRR